MNFKGARAGLELVLASLLTAKNESVLASTSNLQLNGKEIAMFFVTCPECGHTKRVTAQQVKNNFYKKLIERYPQLSNHPKKNLLKAYDEWYDNAENTNSIEEAKFVESLRK